MEDDKPGIGSEDGVFVGSLGESDCRCTEDGGANESVHNSLDGKML